MAPECQTAGTVGPEGALGQTILLLQVSVITVGTAEVMEEMEKVSIALPILSAVLDKVPPPAHSATRTANSTQEAAVEVAEMEKIRLGVKPRAEEEREETAEVAQEVADI